MPARFARSYVRREDILRTRMLEHEIARLNRCLYAFSDSLTVDLTYQPSHEASTDREHEQH
jgi:hypothetical protein